MHRCAPIAGDFLSPGVERRLAGARGGPAQRPLDDRRRAHQPLRSGLEHGARTPRVDTATRLASSLSVPPAELLAGITWRLGHVEVVDGDFEVDEPKAD